MERVNMSSMINMKKNSDGSKSGNYRKDVKLTRKNPEIKRKLVTSKQKAMLKELIFFCEHWGITLQADTGNLQIGLVSVLKINSEAAHVLNPNPKLNGQRITLKS